MEVMDRIPAGRVSATLSLPFDSFRVNPADGAAPRELILLLHGFSESGERMLRKLAPAIPPELQGMAVTLAPNAPFLLPHKTDAGFVATFSWYFFEPGANDYYIDMEPSIDFLASGLQALGLAHLPKRIIGFSQGGFMAPIAASRLGNIRQFIGIGCEYLVDEIPGTLPHSVPYRVDAIHGAEDASVDPLKARDSHRRLTAAGVEGSFTMLEGVTHKIDDRVRAEVTRALSLG